MTRVIESVVYWIVFSDISRKLAAVCERFWHRIQDVLIFLYGIEWSDF